MNYTILQGDNRETLKTLADCSIDAIVTDPPYGIDFLGKAWDANTGALETYQECLRVLKPGGYILAFSAARTYHHLAVTLEQAGFEIRDQLMWLYASGFPKAQDIGKAIQKRQGVEEYEEIIQPKNEGMGTAYNDKAYRYNEDNSNETVVRQRAICTSPEAQQWEGWKTALKPSHEPICMARKPFKGSTIDNVLEHGVGALNIDATRIPLEHNARTSTTPNHIQTNSFETINTDEQNSFNWTGDPVGFVPNEAGRFPSNVIGLVEGYQKFFYCPKVSRKERHTGTDNNHPTVKPVELMKYLIKLVTTPNSTVLDPFSGSGSTGMAAVELGHTYIGCELDPAYVEIAKTRIEAWNTTEYDNKFAELFENQGQ